MLRRILLLAIRFYRRRLSGRGPFARVRCTFCGLESCSAFGERILTETPSTLRAVRRILRRLGRCRGLSLYRLPEGRLGWGSGYDPVLTSETPQEGVRQLERALAQDGEGNRVCAAVGRAAGLVAVAAGEAVDALASPSAPMLAVRDSAGMRRVLAQRLGRRCLFALAAAGLGGTAYLVGLGAGALVPCLLGAALALAQARAARHLLRRLEWLEVLAAIEGPGQKGPAEVAEIVFKSKTL
jgi:putative component of membrane protein insertase Oxa1/YidC/SpoIIIJ protein YidD